MQALRGGVFWKAAPASLGESLTVSNPLPQLTAMGGRMLISKLLSRLIDYAILSVKSLY